METCVESFGLFPCSTSIGGSAFLMAVYGFILFRGAAILASGGDLLVDFTPPASSVAGFLPSLIGALPAAIVVLVSGLRSSDTVNELPVGIGALVGSVLMLVTIVWGKVLLAGRCNLDHNGVQVDGYLNYKWDLLHSGITADDSTSRFALGMAATTLLYLCIQVPALFGLPHLWCWCIAGGVLCLLCLLVLGFIQVLRPEIKQRSQLQQKRRFLRYNAIRTFAYYASRYGGLLGEDGHVSREATSRMFQRFDRDKDGRIDRQEFMNMLVNMEFTAGYPGPLPPPAVLPSASSTNLSQYELDACSTGSGSGPVDPGRAKAEAVCLFWMSEFNVAKVGQITHEEFHKVLCAWFAEKQRRYQDDLPEEDTPKHARQGRGKRDWILTGRAPGDLQVTEPLLDQTLDESDDLELNIASCSQVSSVGSADLALPPTWQTGTLAAAKIIAALVLYAMFASPFVDALTSLAASLALPPFFVALVAAPLACSCTAAAGWVGAAAAKKQKNISSAFNQVFMSVIVHNTLGLGVLLLVVGVLQLPWTYLAEPLGSVGPVIVVGFLAWRHSSLRAIWGVSALLLYPVTIAVIALLRLV